MAPKLIGYFMEDEIYFQGKKQPIRKTPIIGFYRDEHDNNVAHVLSLEGNWYTLNKDDVVMY